MDYSVEGMKAWLDQQKKAVKRDDVERLSIDEAVATVVLVNMIVKYAVDVKNMARDMRRAEFKSYSRRIDELVRHWRQGMIGMLDEEHMANVDRATEQLEEEQATNLFQLYVSCKNEIDAKCKESDTELRALAWRVVLLIGELSKWFARKLPRRYGSLSPDVLELRRIMQHYAGPCQDTSRFKNTELCMIVFDRALEGIRVEYVEQAS